MREHAVSWLAHLGREVVGPGLDERVGVGGEAVARQPDDRRRDAQGPNLPRRLHAHAGRRQLVDVASVETGRVCRVTALAAAPTRYLVSVHDGHLPVGEDEVVGAALPHAPHRLGAVPGLAQLHAAGVPQQRPGQNLRARAIAPAGPQHRACTH